MYQTMEIYMARKKKVPDRFLPNTCRILDENLFDVSLDENRMRNPPLFQKSNNPPPPHPRSPNRNNMPHPYYAKFIRDNVRFLNEPITYMGTANTKHKQLSTIIRAVESHLEQLTEHITEEEQEVRNSDKENKEKKHLEGKLKEKTEWWPRTEETVPLHKPSYDWTTTQRSNFCKLTNSSHQTRHGCNPHKTPLQGIAPLASPRGRNRLPKLFQEGISFLHQYDSRLTPNEPIRGKRHGGFVWREIKTESGPGIPQGTRPVLNAIGSHALQQPQTERGNAAESSMTSPNPCLHGSQQMLNSEAHLSKTELREAAKTNPNVTAREQNSSSSSQSSRRKALAPIGGFVSNQPSVIPK